VVVGSARTSSSTARSSTDLVKGPAESQTSEIGTTPRPEINPIVGLIVYNAALPPGMIREPSVSVPMEIGANPALTATAEPEDDPPVF